MITEVIIVAMTRVEGMMSIVTLRIEGRTEGITMTVIIGQEMRNLIEIEILEGVMTEICLSVMNLMRLMHLNVEILQSMLQQFQEIKELLQKFCPHDQSI